MIKETDGDRFETMRCLNQELTFEAAKKEFALREVDFGPQQMRTLKLIDRDDIMIGISVCRNQDLANVFYRLHLIEAYGTGMGKIMKAYEGTEEKPTIETTPNAFKIILPNINAKYETGNTSVLRAESIASSAAGAEKCLSDEEKVLEYARFHGAVTRNDVIGLLEVSTSTASRVIRKMVKNNLLKQNGKARSTNYTILK